MARLRVVSRPCHRWAVTEMPSWRHGWRRSVTLLIPAAVFLLGAVLLLVGEAMRLRNPGGMPHMVLAGIVLLVAGLVIGLVLVLIAATTSRRRAERSDYGYEEYDAAEQWLDPYRAQGSRRPDRDLSRRSAGLEHPPARSGRGESGWTAQPRWEPQRGDERRPDPQPPGDSGTGGPTRARPDDPAEPGGYADSGWHVLDEDDVRMLRGLPPPHRPVTRPPDDPLAHGRGPAGSAHVWPDSGAAPDHTDHVRRHGGSTQPGGYPGGYPGERMSANERDGMQSSYSGGGRLREADGGAHPHRPAGAHGGRWAAEPAAGLLGDEHGPVGVVVQDTADDDITTTLPSISGISTVPRPTAARSPRTPFEAARPAAAAAGDPADGNREAGGYPRSEGRASPIPEGRADPAGDRPRQDSGTGPSADSTGGGAEAAERLDKIKDLYLTAAAIGEDALDRHFDQLSQRQRELIQEYFHQQGMD